VQERHECVVLTQAVIALVAPGLLLPRPVLFIQLPIYCGMLFLLRYQAPGGALWPPASANAMSMTELVAEIRGLQGGWMRAVRIEIGACVVVAAVFLLFGATLVGKVGGTLTAAGALFIGWYLHTYARVTPIPEGLGFAQTVTFFRQMLERQSKRTRDMIWWYLMPLAPGPLVLIIAKALQQPNPVPSLIRGLAAVAIMCVLVVQMNRTARQRIARRIDQLGSVTERP
jgi:hypothetical protein